MKRCDLCGRRIWWWNELKITLRTSPFDVISHVIHDYHLKESEILIDPETGMIQKKKQDENVEIPI